MPDEKISGVPESNEKDRKPYDLRPLTDEEVENIIAAEITSSVNYFDTEIATDQEKALDYYYGRAFGNEVKDRSKVVLTDCRDTVEWIMPGLCRSFFGGRSVVRYAPRTPEDEDWADQVTDHARYSTRRGATGFSVLHDWFKDGLMEKVGAVVIFYEEKVKKDLERYTHLDQEEFDLLAEDDDVEVVAFEETTRTEEADPVEVQNPMTGEITFVPQEPIEVSEYEVHIRRLKPQGRIRVEGIPQEEFLIAGRERRVDDDTTFVGRRMRSTFGDLRAMGMKPQEIQDLPRAKGPERNARDQSLSQDINDVNRPDWAAQEIWLTECWIRIDEDGDGYAELRRILCAGDSKVKIIEDDEVSFIPIATVCPVPMPHRFYGLSVVDLIMDLQLIRSHLLRSMMDNTYLTNNPRVGVVEGEVEIEDLLTSSPGGIVRLRSTDAMVPIPTQQLGPQSWHLLEYLHGIKEDRTGVSRISQGQSDGGMMGASSTSALLEQAGLRVEMIARIYGETGVKRLYENYLKVMKEADVKEEVIRLRDEWVTIDPRAWKADLDVEVEVGLGTQQSALRVDNMMLLHDLQKQAMDVDGRMVTPDNFYNALARVPESMGFTADELFFTRPDPDEPPPDPPPEAALVKAQADQQAIMAKIEMERESLAFRKYQADQEAILKREEMQIRKEIALIQAQGTIRQAEVHAGASESTARVKQETDLAKEVLTASTQAASKPNGSTQ